MLAKRMLGAETYKAPPGTEQVFSWNTRLEFSFRANFEFPYMLTAAPVFFSNLTLSLISTVADSRAKAVFVLLEKIVSPLNKKYETKLAYGYFSAHG